MGAYTVSRLQPDHTIAGRDDVRRIRDVEERLTDWPAMTSGDFHKGPEREASQARDGMWLGKGVRWTVSGRPRAKWLDGQMNGWTEDGYGEVLRLLHHRRNYGHVLDPWWWCSKSSLDESAVHGIEAI